MGWVDQIGGEGEASGRGVSGGDGTGVRCGSAGVEYPKDYGWLNVTKSLTGSEPPRSSPLRSQQRCTLAFRVGDEGNLAISEANKAPAESSELTAVQRYGPDPHSLPGS